MSIEWKNSPIKGLRRGREKRPGWDDGPGGINCQHTPKDNHGKHCETWFFYVATPGFGVSLEIFEGTYPGAPEHMNHKPKAASLTEHSAVRPSWASESEAAPVCHIIEAPCWAGTGYTRADTFYKEYGHGTYDETEEFWIGLEKWFFDLKKQELETD